MNIIHICKNVNHIIIINFLENVSMLAKIHSMFLGLGSVKNYF